ncbi:hypothetical protein K458DRAFT_395478 [Lentithecium fluviatile CBS 122367]|uniref:Auxin efflux carrier n=1 Tax=Lentithecium fluviatile CBS 122367 TaxID=1168545 RepID=A0A6G1IHX7_9PLEO|nr:hypothetical protein K458DRAFT_395478 [Lentithecium fluviatile CBS 122367]
MASELLVPFVGAIEAAVSVLLTIFFGVLAAQCNLLSPTAAKEISRLCVRMFLPALLIYKIGSNLQQDTGVRYVPILIWSITYTLLSLGIGTIACRIFKAPSWVKLACCFNNTTSLPLLLIQSLGATGILNSIILDGDTSAAALDRAESYFLVSAMVSNSLTFALGPRLLRPSDEDAPDDDKDDADDGELGEDGEDADAMERGPDGIIDEETSLLPQRLVRHTNHVERRGYRGTLRWMDRLPPWLQTFLDFAFQFANAPLIGAIVGAVIGLTPPLHRLFFNDSNEGGYLNAWLTSAVKNIGDLFASTQIIVVGVKLSQSLRKMKAGEDSGVVPKASLAFITFIRFVFWPLVSIPFIWVLATKTSLLNGDPILYFVLMLMPTGPPAMILVALTDVVKSPEEEKMAIAKLLTISYSITPLICFAVVGALKATESAISSR